SPKRASRLKGEPSRLKENSSRTKESLNRLKKAQVAQLKLNKSTKLEWKIPHHFHHKKTAKGITLLRFKYIKRALQIM
ncbi:hypothetical protein, partial [Viridibacillus arvi]|uniref:hypothetical protein n=1 Tax=Viridibacillus arvi TaxID=263475 RepID=UPI003D0712DC